MDRLTSYRKLNKSFKKKLVFNLGSEGGFYSEFNNMVFAILYCLKYEYQFVLYSKDANFKTNKGWLDYFEPFCDSTESIFHHYYNKRTNKPSYRWQKNSILKLYKLINPNKYLTYELWGKIYNADFEKELFDIPELAVKGNLRESSRIIVDMIYKFNSNALTEINETIQKIRLPKTYASVNIRKGDKNTEWGFIELDNFIVELKNRTREQNLFVFTDDYSMIIELKKKYPQFNYFFLVEQDEFGYIHSDFINLDNQKRKSKIIKLFSTIEIVCNSSLCIGTYTTNPGLFLGMRMKEKDFISIQKSSWYQFEVDDVTAYKV